MTLLIIKVKRAKKVKLFSFSLTKLTAYYFNPLGEIQIK